MLLNLTLLRLQKLFLPRVASLCYTHETELLLGHIRRALSAELLTHAESCKGLRATSSTQLSNGLCLG